MTENLRTRLPMWLLCCVALLGIAALGGDWGTAYGQTSGPTPTTPAEVRSSLQARKRVDRSVARPGDPVVFTIVVNNEGNGAATDVVVTDQVPAPLEVLQVVTTRGTATVVGQRVTVSVGTLQPGEVVTITIQTRVRLNATRGPVVNSASVSSSSQSNVDTNEVVVTIEVDGGTGNPTPPSGEPTATPIPGGGRPSATPVMRATATPVPGRPARTPAPVVPPPASLPNTSAPASPSGLMSLGIGLLICGLAVRRQRARRTR